MKRMFRKIIALMLAGMTLAQSAALADTISFSGTIAASQTYEIYAPIGGMVGSVEIEVGQTVCAGDVLATLRTTKVYATESGTVTGLFGQPGDVAETVADRYGAVMYIEGESVYTISASTDNAYNETANKFVHIGEKVYLNCYSDSAHNGTGVITSISGANYTVEVLSGEFLVGETVSIYRGDAAISANRIGRGPLSRKNPTAVTGSGSIVSFAVSDGDTVQRGDLLFETLEGSFDGFYMSGSQILAEIEGTVAQLNVSQGSKVSKDSVVAIIYPANAMRIEAQVEESDLASVAVGDLVTIELIWNQDEEVTYEGSISMISSVPNAESNGNGTDGGAVTYNAYVDFMPDVNTRYGMSSVISTIDEEIIDEQE